MNILNIVINEKTNSPYKLCRKTENTILKKKLVILNEFSTDFGSKLSNIQQFYFNNLNFTIIIFITYIQRSI